jgi:cytochrome c peroxidase
MKGTFTSVALLVSLLLFIPAANFHEKTGIGTEASISRFREDSKSFSASISALQNALIQLDSANSESFTNAQNALKTSRKAYKKIEYILEYFFYTSTRIYNRAPKNEIEEPYLEYQQPSGLQYMEAMLYETQPVKNKSRLIEQSRFLATSAQDLNALMYQFSPTDRQLLESIRLELIRIITLGITGFDAPMLKSGISESEVALESIQTALSPYLNRGKIGDDSLQWYLQRSLHYLRNNPDFDTFNRLAFLTEHALPLQKHLGSWIKRSGLEMNKDHILNYNAENIFARDAFNSSAFGQGLPVVSNEEIALGKKLFSENMLSGNASKSCAACHNPGNYFMDGLTRSVGFLPGSEVKRNAPSLLYAGYQHSQFWDGSAPSLEAQIETVIKNPVEMHGDISQIIPKLNNSKTYRKAFRKAFQKKRSEQIEEKDIYRAIASYIRTLNPYNAPFDQYIAGNKHALTENQKSGFNLFMGKAKCGTCHFAPLFNGLIPPDYMLTEFEILGTTLTENLLAPQPDPDPGRYAFRPIPFYKGAFKTPTVRNAAVTGPYMHNGVFQSLETLLEFYNQGGGAGLGLELPNQTLSASKLFLSEKDKKDIIEFLHSLTDDLKNI